jgi:hypothetical protein
MNLKKVKFPDLKINFFRRVWDPEPGSGKNLPGFVSLIQGG